MLILPLIQEDIYPLWFTQNYLQSPIYCRCPDSFLFFSFKVLHDTYFWLQLCIVYSKLPFLCSLYTVSTQYTRILGSGVFDQDQYDLYHTDTLFIFDDVVRGRNPAFPQTVQYLLHGEVLLSAYFPMPLPGFGPTDLQVTCHAEPVVLPDPWHQRKQARCQGAGIR